MKDKPGVNFIMTTVIGGLIFLVPVMFLVFRIGKAIGFMMVMASIRCCKTNVRMTPGH